MKTVDTKEYVSMLRELVDEGKEVSMLVSGSSMTPFLVHQRDYVCFKQPDRTLRAGDIVFYQRENGQYVMHRIYKVKGEEYYMVGDAQTEIEGPLRREQIFGIITKAKRKDTWIYPGALWWEFFAKVWIRCVKIRPKIWKIYNFSKRLLTENGKNNSMIV